MTSPLTRKSFNGQCWASAPFAMKRLTALLVINDFKFSRNWQYEFYYIAEPLAKHRIHGGNTLAGSGPEALKRQRS